MTDKSARAAAQDAHEMRQEFKAAARTERDQLAIYYRGRRKVSARLARLEWRIAREMVRQREREFMWGARAVPSGLLTDMEAHHD